MTFTRILFGLVLAAAIGPVAAPIWAAPFPAVTTAFLDAHCVECHDSEVKKGGLDLTSLEWKMAERPNFDVWLKIHDRIEKGEMPPAGEARPESAEQQRMLNELGGHLHENSAKEQAQRGRTVLRRLNRVEYENSVRALLGVEVPLSALLPEDTPAHGFDTVAEGLRLSTLQMEKYLEAADVALEDAIQLAVAPEKISGRHSFKDEQGIRENIDTPAGTIKDKDSGNKHVITLKELPDAIVFFSDADYRSRIKKLQPRAPGRYRIRVSAYGHQTHGEPVMMRIYADNYRERRLLGWFDMPADKPREVEIVARLEKTEGISVGALNIGYDDEGKGVYNVGAPDYKGRGLAIQWVEAEGPLQESWPPASTKDLFPGVPIKENPKRPWRDGKRWGYDLAPENPAADLQRVVTSLAERAFRRPLQPGEADRFVALAQGALANGSTFDEAARLGFRAVLTAPQFLLFEEAPGPLSGSALASRLSYFLWSAPPDEILLKLAVSGELAKPETLRAQTERLLRDPRAAQFVKNFTGQWLEMRNIEATTPDTKLYPEFDEILQVSMVAETEAYFREMLEKDLDATYLVKSDFALLNRRLAEHYGIPGVQGAGEVFQRVSLPADSVRGGILTQASVLKVTANGTVTSPVTRGTWVMKHLLGQPPSPPPPNVGSVEPDTRGATTIREQLDKHRDSETCASCHRSIDPPGFALESFDVIGGWRERYRSQEKGDRPPGKLRGRGIGEYKLGLPVDASGQLADGRAFQDIREFRQLLVSQRDRLQRTMAENLTIYGTGAGISFADRKAVAELVQRAEKKGGGLRTVLHEVVQSELFQNK